MSLRPFVVAAALIVLTACNKPTDPPRPPDAPTLACPASASVDSPENLPVPVTFAVPAAVGGQLPVSVTCSAQPGAPFPLGSTIVTCTATDALQRQASCNFNISVRATPRIAKTKFLAFGDSITEGYKVDPYVPQMARTGFRLFGLGPSHSYPFKLNAALVDRYRAQTIVVDNEGIGGEMASAELTEKTVDDGRSVGEIRLPGVLNLYNPEVLLLMEGTNDLYHGLADAASYTIPALEGMIDQALGRGIQVFLGTVPPQRPGRRPDRTAVVPLIPGFNDALRSLAQRKGITLVDVYAALNTNLNLYIGDDDLHLTEQGFQVVADTFFAAIREKLDTTPASQFAQRRP